MADVARPRGTAVGAVVPLLLSDDGAVWAVRTGARALHAVAPVPAPSPEAARRLVARLVQVSVVATVALFFLGFALFHRQQERERKRDP